MVDNFMDFLDMKEMRERDVAKKIVEFGLSSKQNNILQGEVLAGGPSPPLPSPPRPEVVPGHRTWTHLSFSGPLSLERKKNYSLPRPKPEYWRVRPSNIL